MREIGYRARIPLDFKGTCVDKEELKQRQRDEINEMLAMTGLTGTGLARKAKLAQTTVNRLLSGKAKNALSADTMYKLREASGFGNELLDRNRMLDAIEGTIDELYERDDEPDAEDLARTALYLYDYIEGASPDEKDDKIRQGVESWAKMKNYMTGQRPRPKP